jgi:3-hydroxymyristoyl/3-hydroxydecanoyl-(acyl carrier protein) dehydratase
VSEVAPAATLAIRITRTLPAAHAAFAGHFPSQPLLPGVVLLAEVLEAALADVTLAALLGARPTLASAKFLAPVSPEGTAPIELAIEFQPLLRGARFEVQRGGVTVARGQFNAGEVT